MNQYSHLMYCPNKPQAEMIVMMLAEESIPATLQATAGLDLPGAYEMGGFNVMVRPEDLEKAQQLTQEDDADPEPKPRSRWKKILEWLDDAWILGS